MTIQKIINENQDLNQIKNKLKNNISLIIENAKKDFSKKIDEIYNEIERKTNNILDNTNYYINTMNLNYDNLNNEKQRKKMIL